MSRTPTSPGQLGLTDRAFWIVVVDVIREPPVLKSWADVGRSTRVAVRESRDAWKRHR